MTYSYTISAHIFLLFSVSEFFTCFRVEHPELFNMDGGISPEGESLTVGGFQIL
jgi:hypothetical protein